VQFGNSGIQVNPQSEGLGIAFILAIEARSPNHRKIIHTMVTNAVEPVRIFRDQRSKVGASVKPVPVIAKTGIMSRSTAPLPRSAASAKEWIVATQL
jgi:hypothetical protein